MVCLRGLRAACFQKNILILGSFCVGMWQITRYAANRHQGIMKSAFSREKQKGEYADILCDSKRLDLT